jgi:hypothetical protein
VGIVGCVVVALAQWVPLAPGAPWLPAAALVVAAGWKLTP